MLPPQIKQKGKYLKPLRKMKGGKDKQKVGNDINS